MQMTCKMMTASIAIHIIITFKITKIVIDMY